MPPPLGMELGRGAYERPAVRVSKPLTARYTINTDVAGDYYIKAEGIVLCSTQSLCTLLKLQVAVPSPSFTRHMFS
jgi:hypothetical protein